MTTADYLTVLNILVALLGLLLVGFTLYEYWRLKAIRDQFAVMREEMRAENHRLQKATQRVIASYSAKTPDDAIELLRSALSIEPSAFNAWNAMGYAFMQKGETVKALDSFQQAVALHPKDKEGYCDVAWCYMQMKEPALCREYLAKAIAVDPSAKADIEKDPRFKPAVVS